MSEEITLHALLDGTLVNDYQWTVYETVHNAVTGTSSYPGYDHFNVGQWIPSTKYNIYRGYIMFDTSSIPLGAIILSAKLYIKTYQKQDFYYEDFDIVIRKPVDPLYPHYPYPEDNDYLYTRYEGNYGSINTAEMAEEMWSCITLTNYEVVICGGITKILLIDQNDIDAIAPIYEKDNNIYFYAMDFGINYAPYIVIEYEAARIINVRAEPDSTRGAIEFYGDIITEEEIAGGGVVEEGFEYLIQDEEPTEEATGIECIKEKPIGIEFWEIGEYSAYETERDLYEWENSLYHLLGDEYKYEHDIIWWFRAYYKDGENNKFTAETWMKNVPTVITSECTEVLAQEATGNGELTDKGANIVTRLGFRIIKEYSGDLMGANSYTREWDGYLVAVPLEEHPIYDVNGIFITGWYYTGIFYRDAFFPKSQTEGDFDLGIYLNILGGGFNGEGFGYYLKPNDTLKIQAIARNDLGIGYGDDIFEITTGQNLLYEADEPIISPTSVEKSVTLRNIPEGAIATRVGIRFGRTSSCNEIDVFEDGEWGNDDKVTFFIPDLVPGEKYYEKPYIVLHYVSGETADACIEGHWYEVGDLVYGTDGRLYICIVAHFGAPDNCPITGENWAKYWILYEWEEEIINEEEEPFEVPDWDEDWDYDEIIPTYEEYNYKTVIREIRCEKMSDQSFIDKAGRRRSITLINHLIQTEEVNKEVINAYLEQFQIIKLKVSIDYDIPIPFERGDVILIGEGKHKFKADGEGEILFKADGEGEISFANSILAKIRKIDSSFTSGIETILGLELEV